MAKAGGSAGRVERVVESKAPMNMTEARAEAKRRLGPTAMLTVDKRDVREDGTKRKHVGVMSEFGPGANWLGSAWTWEEAIERAVKRQARDREILAGRF